MLSLPGSMAPRGLPFRSLTFAAWRSRYDVVGVRSSKWNERSGRTVTRAGMGIPGVTCAVRALNSYVGVKDRWKYLGQEYYLAEVHALYTFTT